MDGLSADQFQGVHKKDIPIVEDLLTLNILLYDIDILDGNIIGELVRRNVQKYKNTVRLLGYNNHIFYVNNINAVSQSFCCPNCETFFNRTFNLERNLTTCSKRVKKVNPLNVCQTQKTLFDKLNSFGIEYTNGQILFKNVAIFEFESTCVQEESFKDIDTTKLIKAYSHLGFHFLKSCERTNFSLQLWSSSSRYFFNRCSWKFSSPKSSNIGKLVLWNRDNDKNWTAQHLGETYPTL